MRTYNRNQATHKFSVTKIKDVCRLCMNVDTTMHDIFAVSQEPAATAMSLALKIHSCLAIEVRNTRTFPTKLCSDCLRSIDAFLEFRERCHLINEKLHQLVENSINSPCATEGAFLSSPQSGVDVCSSAILYSDVPAVNTISSESSNLSVYDQTSLHSARNNVSKETNKQGLPVQAAQLNDVSCESQSYDTASNLYVDPESPQMQVEEVSDTDDCEDTLQVKVSMNGDSYVIQVLNQMDEKKDPTVSAKDCPSSSVGETPTSSTHATETTTCQNKSDSSLLKHQAQNHDVRGFLCQFCSKGFSLKSAVLRHERTHSGEKPYTCAHCSKSFSQKEILRRHVLTHSSDKPFKCTACTKSYTQKEALKMHFRNNHVPRTITEIIQYPCSLCDKSFCHLSGLSRHQQYHAGKKYPCKNCDRVFTDQSCLRRHNQKLHLSEKNNSEKTKQIAPA